MCNRKRVVLPLLLPLILFVAASLPGTGKCAGGTAEGEREYVSIDFNDVEIYVFIKFMSKITGRNFVVDQRVRGKVTIISPTKVTVEEAYDIFQSVLEIHGYSTVRAGKVTKIIPVSEARTQNVDTRTSGEPEKPEDKIVTRIVNLKYAQANELKRLFAPLVPKGSVVLSYPDTNTLVITATLSSINRLLKIIEEVDVKRIGRKISVLPVAYADVKNLVENLSKIFTARVRGEQGKPSTDLMVKFVGDERTNSIIVLASDIETERVERLVEMLDKKVPRGGEKIRVYYLEHASAEDLADVLQEIPSKESDDKKGKKFAPIVSENVKIKADSATNSLVIMADKEDYPVLEQVIAKLDIPRAMVYIECLIMEVNVNKGLNVGTEWRIGEGYDEGSEGEDQGVFFGGFGGTGDSGYDNFNTVATGSLPTGFSVGVVGEMLEIGDMVFPSIGAVVQALRSDEDVYILSTPQILTTDNEEAAITVGKNVPYQTRSAAEDASETYSSYEYKDVGISLKITPQISKDRFVRLNVHQEVTRLDTAAIQTSADRPTTLKREIETTIIVKDGHTVVIGGLIDKSLSETRNRVPCLGGIPALGYLFKNVSTGNEKTNLYVFLTPRVLKSPDEAEKIYREKNKEIDTIRQGNVELYEKMEIGDDRKKRRRNDR